MDHIKRRLQTEIINPEILPISLFIELKYLMMLSNLVDGRYDVDMQRFYQLKQSKRRGIQFVLPKVTSEILRLIFWYRVPFRANLLAKSINITDPTSNENKLLNLMWKKFISTSIEVMRFISSSKF